MNAWPDELCCDLAETYGVYDWRALPINTAATLAQGLSPYSRVARAIAGGGPADEKTLLLAVIADRLGHLAWMFSEDGSRGENHPPSLVLAMTGEQKPQNAGYDDGTDFTAAWAALTGGEKN